MTTNLDNSISPKLVSDDYPKGTAKGDRKKTRVTRRRLILGGGTLAGVAAIASTGLNSAFLVSGKLLFISQRCSTHRCDRFLNS